MTGTNKTPTTGGRRRRTHKKGGSTTLAPAPVQAGGADKDKVVMGGCVTPLESSPFKGGNGDKVKGGSDDMTKVKGGEYTKEVKGGNDDKKSMSGGEDIAENGLGEKDTSTVGGKKSGKACGKAYCVKCKKNHMPMTNCRNVTSKNGRSMLKGNCKKCGTKMNKFI